MNSDVYASPPSVSTPGAADAMSAPLDMLLTSAAPGPLSLINPGGAAVRLAADWQPGPGPWPGVGGSCSPNWAASRQARPPCSTAPRKLGGSGLMPLCEAPGTYVYDH